MTDQTPSLESPRVVSRRHPHGLTAVYVTNPASEFASGWVDPLSWCPEFELFKREVSK